MIKNTLVKCALFAALFASKNVFAYYTNTACTGLPLTVVNKTALFNVTITPAGSSPITLRPGPSGSQAAFCMPQHATWKLGLDSAKSPSPWITYGYGFGGISYSNDASGTDKNFTVSLGPSSVASPAGNPPNVTVVTNGAVLGTYVDSWKAGFQAQLHGPIAPTTVTFS